MKQRDVYHTPSLLVTHRLQDAFTLCTHRFDPEQGGMVPLPAGETDPNTTYLMLEDGRLIFDGSVHDLVHSEQSIRASTRVRNLIGGQWLPSGERQDHPRSEPCRPYGHRGRLPSSHAEDVELAVAAAKKAFATWRLVPHQAGRE